MNDTSHRTEGTPLAGDADLLAALADSWRSLFIDLPLSMGCLPQSLAADSLRFASHRLHAQAKYLEALSHCRTLNDAVKLQSSFATRAMSDYQNEAGVLLGETKQAVSGDRS